MTKKDYETLVSCIEMRTRDNGTEFYCIKDGTPEHIKKAVSDIAYNDLQSNIELQYEIMNSALNFLSHYSLEDLDIEKITEDVGNDTHANVYIAVRLGYLNVHNQDEISEFVQNYKCDIQDACAIWYDEQVSDMVLQLVEYIINN